MRLTRVEWVFVAPYGWALKITEDAVTRLRAHAQHDRLSPEAGGVLVGRWLRSGAGVVVDEVSAPMPGDIQARCSFFRSAEPHQRRLEERFRLSDGTIAYLGEWHTHPEPNPEPSAIDLADWARRLEHTRSFDMPAMVFLIVGTQTARCWVGDLSDREIEPCTCALASLEPSK